MSKKGYKQTLEHRKNLSIALKGRPISKETARKISAALKGTMLSEEHKKRISIALLGHSFSNETLQKLSIAQTNYMHKKGGIELLSAIMTKRQNDPEVKKGLSELCKINNPMYQTIARNKVSEARSEWCSQAILDGSYNNVYHKLASSEKFYSKKNSKLLHYRSSYELQAYKLLEQMPDVERYLVESIRIKYISPSGRAHYTIPDILVTFIDKTQAIIEVKPNFKIKWNTEIIKFKAIANYAAMERIGFFIWTEHQLFSSSKTCSACGAINQELTLSDRQWVCKSCGVVHDRDYNAAKNIRRVGQTLQELTYGISQSVS